MSMPEGGWIMPSIILAKPWLCHGCRFQLSLSVLEVYPAVYCTCLTFVFVICSLCVSLSLSLSSFLFSWVGGGSFWCYASSLSMFHSKAMHSGKSNFVYPFSVQHETLCYSEDEDGKSLYECIVTFLSLISLTKSKPNFREDDGDQCGVQSTWSSASSNH